MYHTDNIDQKVDLFYLKLRRCAQTIPQSTVYIQQHAKPWITPLVIHLITSIALCIEGKDFGKYNYLKIKVKNCVSFSSNSSSGYAPI